MNSDAVRLGLGVVWLTVAATHAYSPTTDDRLVAGVALALAAWNVARWYARRGNRPPQRSARQPLRRRGETRAEEYHPEFDFTERDGG